MYIYVLQVFIFSANIVGFFLKSKDDVEVLLVGNLAKNDNLDVNSRSMTSGTLCSSKKPPNCNSKRELEECLSADAIGSIQDTTER